MSLECVEMREVDPFDQIEYISKRVVGAEEFPKYFVCIAEGARPGEEGILERVFKSIIEER